MRPSSSTGDYRGWPGAPACTHRAPTATFGETSPKAEVDHSYLHCYVYHKLRGSVGTRGCFLPQFRRCWAPSTGGLSASAGAALLRVNQTKGNARSSAHGLACSDNRLG